MKLEFDSINELSSFLEFARTLGATSRPVETVLRPVLGMTSAELSAEVLRQTADAAESVSPGIAQALAELEDAQGNAPAPAGEPSTVGATIGSTKNAADIAASEPTKRKRRTKAEMEAARAAEASPQSEPLTGSPNVDNAGSNPFEAAASEASSSTATTAILNAPNGQAATLAGIAAMQTQSPFDPAPSAQAADVSATEPSATTAGSSTTNSTDAATFLETRSLELLTAGEPIKTVEHMHKCRDFIAKHGQAKYLESFPLAGLTATIGTFKPEQCARHQAALEFLSANA